jgi:hypothetical protein
MDSEEQRLRHQVEAREIALKTKINMLKERIERLKRMGDVKSQVEQRPGLMFTGSVLAGFILKRLVNGKNRHAANTYRTDSRNALSPTSASAAGPVSAIISAIATRAAIGVITETVRNLFPPRRERWRPGRKQK